MSKYVIEKSTLDAIGDAIRAKDGSTELIPPLEMPAAIAAALAGGLNVDLPEGFAMEMGTFRLAGNENSYILPLKNRFTTNIQTGQMYSMQVYATTSAASTAQMMFVFRLGLGMRTAQYGAVQNASRVITASTAPQLNPYDSVNGTSSTYEFDSLSITAGTNSSDGTRYKLAGGCEYVYCVIAKLAETEG